MERIPDIRSRENWREVPVPGWPGMVTGHVDPIRPVPVGAVVALMFRVTAYDTDCDGSQMARLERINNIGEGLGSTLDHLTLAPNDTVRLTDPSELCQWVGLPEIGPRESRRHACSYCGEDCACSDGHESQTECVHCRNPDGSRKGES